MIPLDPEATPPTSVPGFARTLGPVAVLLLTLSATTPASSVFVIVPGLLHVAGSGALVAMALAAIVCVATAFVYAELSAAWPVAGGEYVMVARTLGPLAGFIVLGVNIVNNLIFLPVVALGLSAVLARIVPDAPPIPMAVVMLALSTMLGLLNVRVNAIVTGVFLLVEIAALLLVTLLGLATPARELGGLMLHPIMATGAGVASPSWAAIGTAATMAVFALNGYGMAVYFGEDLHEAPRRIARIVLWALGLTLAAELAPLTALMIAAPDLRTTFLVDDPFGDLVTAGGGPALAGWVAAGIAIAILNAAIVSVLAFARFLFASARDRAWGRPLDRWLVAVHPRFGSPWASTLAVGAVGIACCFVPLDMLLVTSGAGLVLTYAAIGAAAIVGRRTGATAHAPYRMPWFPLWPVITLLALAGIVWSNWMDVTEGRPGLIATAVQIVVSAAYYLLVLRRRGPWTSADPA